MSTPPNERPQPEPEGSDPGRRSAAPLVWLILLIALGAIAWYFASQRETADVPLDPIAPAEVVRDGEQDEAASDGETPATVPAAREPAPAAPVPDDRGAEPLSRVQPTYPAAALRSREEGTVLLRVEVDAEGNATSVDVERSSRSRDLDRAARDAVREWTFSPAIENGQPVASVVTVPVDFRVEAQ